MAALPYLPEDVPQRDGHIKRRETYLRIMDEDVLAVIYIDTVGLAVTLASKSPSVRPRADIEVVDLYVLGRVDEDGPARDLTDTEVPEGHAVCLVR